MGEMRLTVVHTGQGDAMTCVTPQGATMTFDNPDTGVAGGSPMQHLLAAIGACSLMDINIILRKKRIAFTDLAVDLVAARRDEPFPRVFTDIRLVFRVKGEVPAQTFADVTKLAVEKYCSVAGTVTSGAPVAFETVVG